MPILEQDIRLLASQVMSDVPEGGGAPTGSAIVDGASNNMFDDISELDHVYGNVSLRKVFASVDTTDRDKYLGANVIVMQPPADSDVNAVLFSTGDTFDTRATATARIEAYLTRGATYGGQLFSDHITGQRQVLIQQKLNTPLPGNGDTLVLTQFDGSGSTPAYSQFVRVTDVASETRTFTVSTGTGDQEVPKLIVTLTISSPLEHDFTGFDPIYYETGLDYTSKARVYETTVADAAVYFGVVPLETAASFGDFTVQGTTIFSQLVPSSRTEVAVADARMNQQLDTALGTGVDAAFSAAVVFDATHPLYVGGGILPGTLSVAVSGGAALTDRGGNLIDAGGQRVGTVDYSNGILKLATSVFGSTVNAKAVAYKRAAPVTLEGESIGIDITPANRRLTWAITLQPTPAKGSLQVSYLSGGKWYVLQEDGSGAVRGTDTAFGAGVLNFTTGTLSLTLGALPDAPSSIIATWAPPAAANAVPVAPIAGAAKAFIEIALGQAVGPGTVTVTWPGGKTSTDTSLGAMGGDATGTVDYTSGVVYLSPNALPAPGTVFHAIGTQHTAYPTDSIAVFTDSGAHWTGALAHGGIVAGSVSGSLFINFPFRKFPGTDVDTEFPQGFTDDGLGNLRVPYFDYTTGDYAYDVVGTIDYATGAISLSKIFTYHSRQPTFETVYPLGSGDHYVRQSGYETRALTTIVQNGTIESGSGAAALRAAYMTASGSGASVDVAGDKLVVVGLPEGKSMAPGATFTIGTTNYLGESSGTVVSGVDPSTGVGTAAGTWISLTSRFELSAWQAGASPAILNFSAVAVAPQTTPTTLATTDGITFRTASAPIAPSGFQVNGALDGVAFSVTADADGKIHGDHVFGTIDYNTGVVRLRFGDPTTAVVGPTVVDLTSFGIVGLTNVALRGAALNSLRYNAVTYDYLPLDAGILGLDPVRLPSDGRVPIFRKGSVVVVHHTAQSAPTTAAPGDTIDLGTTRLAHVRVIGHDGATITTGYSVDLDAGHVTVSSIAGWSQPVTFESRIEDMALATDVQINGAMRLSRPLSHNYPVGSYVSSALLAGDLYARVSATFSQGTWTSDWEDTPTGSPILAHYDTINHPIVVTNSAAVTERWALIFTSNTAFNIVGEHLGVIGTGSTGTDCAPLNPNTGAPYFRLDGVGFGTGWSAGNVIRLNTVGALADVWVARVVQQGENTVASDSFTLLVRGDVNA